MHYNHMDNTIDTSSSENSSSTKTLDEQWTYQPSERRGITDSDLEKKCKAHKPGPKFTDIVLRFILKMCHKIILRQKL